MAERWPAPRERAEELAVDLPQFVVDNLGRAAFVACG